MTTIAALVAAAPAPDRGVLTQIHNGTGQWRHVVELADPAAGSSIVWHDITDHFTGYDYTRGADTYQGRYRASVATLDLFADDDSLAPWNTDTSPTFGVHVDLGPGLLIRSGFIRVVDDAVDAWNPRFTNKIEEWGDAAYSKGRTRQHRIVARDTLTSLVAVPLPATFEENWSDRMYHFLVDSGWVYGSAIYGAQFEADTTTPILVLPDRPAASSAANELDAICDPVGLVWYTNRLGQLVVRPTVYDTFHADAFAAGATGDQWPSDVTPVSFAWWACSDPTAGAVAYATDQANSFGLDETERSVVNHVRVVAPTGTFDDDDPISIQRYDRHTFQASWMAENDVAAADLLAFRANATVEARPLHTTLELPGFHHGADTVDFLGYIAIDHRNRDDGLAAYANGYLRNYVEQVAPRGCDVDWLLTVTVDVYHVESDAGLLPVEDLTLVDVTDTEAEFSWTNPAQTITPTATQIRLLNPASLWVTVAYPISGVIWHALEPSTGYEFQVRLIRVVDGLITHVSPSRSLTFVTDPTTVPDIISVGGDGDTHVEFPPPEGPCDEIDWELQESADGVSGWAMIESGTITDPPWEVTIPDVIYDGTKFYRIVADACGDVTTSNLFVGHCTDPAILGDAPFSDDALVFYFPALCPPDTLVEAISEEPASKGYCFDLFTTDAAGNIVLVADGDGLVAYGPNPTMDFTATLDGLTGDTTIACKVQLAHPPTADQILFAAAGLYIYAVADGANWSLEIQAHEAGIGMITTSGVSTLNFGQWYDVAIVHDVAAGDLGLYIAGNVEGAASGVGERVNPGGYGVGVTNDGLITNCAAWNRVLDPTELPGYIAAPDVTINQKAGQADPTSTSPILYTIVFSEAVTGFAAGDITLSGTAGGTLAKSITGSGATYELSVTGMTTGGTVIATIPASVCTSVATGLPNQASTSTDNQVTWSGVVITDDFNRANGALGANWTEITATIQILGNQLSLAANGFELWHTAVSSPDQYAQLLVTGYSYVGTDVLAGGVFVRCNVGGTAGYLGQIVRTIAGGIPETFRIIRLSSNTVIASVASAYPSPSWTIRLEAHDVGGNIQLDLYKIVSGTPTLMVSFTDTTPGSGEVSGRYVGMNGVQRTGSLTLDNFEAGSL